MSCKGTGAAVLMIISPCLLATATCSDVSVTIDTEKRCPVCGMFVEQYSDWIATVVFDDGSRQFFDGPKDMFRFLLEPEKYGHDIHATADILVTEYYSTELMSAREVVYVVGSDVLGPMGHELVPVATPEDADTFVRDHGGAKTLTFDDVTEDDIPK